jgi:hypothetical protein
MSIEFQTLGGAAFDSAGADPGTLGGTAAEPATRLTIAGWDLINGELYPAYVEDPALVA